MMKHSENKFQTKFLEVIHLIILLGGLYKYDRMQATAGSDQSGQPGT
jgi:hypothetical protein